MDVTTTNVRRQATPPSKAEKREQPDFQQLWLNAGGTVPPPYGAPGTLPAASLSGLGDGCTIWDSAPIIVDRRQFRHLGLQDLLAFNGYLSSQADIYEAQAAFIEAIDPVRGKAARLWVEAFGELWQTTEQEINRRFTRFFYQDVED
jgi:hypothetical protein